MIVAQSVSERVYIDIRTRLLAGEYRLRERLDVATLARAMRVSATPVREALVRLASERLISVQPTRGFFVYLWSGPELHALYQWRGLLADIGVAKPTQLALAPAASSHIYADRVRSVFTALMTQANDELARACFNADDRLHLARSVEAELFADVEAELDALIEAASDADRLRAALIAYHQRRLEAAARIRERAFLRALPPNGS